MYGNFDFAQGTDFEKKFLRYLWKTYPENSKMFCKPDIYDVTNRIFYEAKYTRPYYDKDPARYSDAKDLGTGLPKSQYERYSHIRKGGLRVIFVHKLSEGKYKDCVFITELTDELEMKKNISDGGKTVYWYYHDLNWILNSEL